MPKPAASPEATAHDPEDHLEIDLKDPLMAAFLAWLLPGLGHWYQGRTHKAVLFFVCIMGTFGYGLYLGEGRVVYASWRPPDRRLPYLCQVWVGLPALPAAVQALREKPIKIFGEEYMSPPQVNPPEVHREDELDRIQKRLHHFWELGTVYTMIAGLLNVLAMYDAWGGPAYSAPAPTKKDGDDSGGDADKKEGAA